MSKIWVARRTERLGFYLPDNNVMVFLPLTHKQQMGAGQLDEIVRSQLEKQGITEEKQITKIVENAEKNYEYRIKVKEVQKKIRHLMQMKKDGATLMQRGHQNWVQTFYRQIGGKNG